MQPRTPAPAPRAVELSADEEALRLLDELADAGNWQLAASVLATYPPRTADRILVEFKRRLRVRLAGSPGTRRSQLLDALRVVGGPFLMLALAAGS